MSFDIEIQAHGVTVGAWRTNAKVVPSQGYGGHPAAARPKSAALTVYEGRQPFALTVPVYLDLGLEADGKRASIEAVRKQLETLSTAQPGSPPPPVRIQSNRGPLPIPPGLEEGLSTGSEWWVEDLVWGEEDLRSDGEPYHVEVVIMLLERVEDQTLGQAGPFVPPTLRTSPAHGYKVKKGDKWHTIAASQLGDASRWREIWELNGKKSDAQLAHMVGQTIRVPANTGSYAQPTSA